MPRRKTVRTTEYNDDDEPRRVEVLPADPEEESYAQFMSKWGREGAKVRVYRVTPQGKQYCFLGTPEEIDPESLRLFHAKQSYAHETGSYLIEVEVNGEVRSPFPILIAPQVNTPGVPEAGAGNPMSEMFKMLQAQNERLERQLQLQNQQEREPLGSLADALVKIDQLRGSQSKELPIDSLIKAIELGKSMGGGAEPDWTMKLLDVLKDSMPAIQGLIGSLTNRAGAIPGGEAMPVIDDDTLLKQGINYLKKKALAGSDPGLYADIIVDNRSEPLYEKLIRRILENDFSAFASVDADLSRPEYEPFFHSIYDGVRFIFTQPDQMEMDTGGESGYTRNVAGNGSAGKKGRNKS